MLAMQGLGCCSLVDWIPKIQDLCCSVGEPDTAKAKNGYPVHMLQHPCEAANAMFVPKNSEHSTFG